MGFQAAYSEGRPTPALAVCTVLGADSVAAHYPNYNLALQPMTAQDLPDSRSCNFDGTSGSGKCNSGICEEYGGVRQLRHHFEPSLRDVWALYHPTRAVFCALLGYHAYWMLIGACDPM